MSEVGLLQENNVPPQTTQLPIQVVSLTWGMAAPHIKYSKFTVAMGTSRGNPRTLYSSGVEPEAKNREREQGGGKEGEGVERREERRKSVEKRKTVSIKQQVVHRPQ